jgi:short-subunit dehydrogenase
MNQTIWHDRVVLITGASSGLGAEMARQLAAGGAKVALVARRADALAALVAEIAAGGGTARAWPADVADAAAMVSVAAAVAAELGPIDVAVANAGIGDLMRSHQFDAALVSRVMRINVEGAANTFGAVLPAMVARRQGQIVGVASLAAWRGLPTSGPYSASKAALDVLLDAMRPELKPYGIAVTTIYPGFVRTPMTDKNDHPMPLMLEVDDAVRIMLHGMARRRATIAFPFLLTRVMRLVHWLPRWLWDPIARVIK